MRRVLVFGSVLLAAVLGLLTDARAATITSVLGNDSPGFGDGDTPTILQLIAAQGGQPPPFDAGHGSDVAADPGDFSEMWTHDDFAPIVDPILSATLTIGIADHDSQASGSQVSAFSVDGTDLTTELHTLFEASGGGDGEYNIYSLAVPGAALPGLADGALVSLGLAAPGLQTALPFLGGGVSETTYNGAFLIFSTLSIETQDTVIPEPSTLVIWSVLGAMGLVFARRRRKTA